MIEVCLQRERMLCVLERWGQRGLQSSVTLVLELWRPLLASAGTVHTWCTYIYTSKALIQIKINTWKIVELDRITNVLVHINIYRILLQTIV